VARDEWIGGKPSADSGAQGPPAAGEGEGTEAALRWSAATPALREVLEAALAGAAKSVLPVDLSVHLVEVSACSYPRFCRNVQEPTCCYLLLAGPAGDAGEDQVARQAIHVEFAPEIAAPIIDMLLGGPGIAASVKGRALTAIERRVLRHMAEAVAGRLSRSFGAAAPKRVEVAGDGRGPAAAQAPADAGAVLLTFRLTGRGASGAMRIHMPADLAEAMLPPRAQRQPSGSTVELTAAMPETSLPAEQAGSLAAGDIVVTETPPDGEVTVRVAGVAKFAGRLGVCNGRRAVTITRRLELPRSS